MKDIKGTKTEQNLREAFAGESQARNIWCDNPILLSLCNNCHQ